MKNIKPIPESVKEHVKAYLEENHLGEFVAVLRHSESLDDDYLYHVIAKKSDNNFSVWTSWNETIQSLNFGHYGLSLDSAAKVHYEFFFTQDGKDYFKKLLDDAFSDVVSSSFCERLFLMEDDITGNTFFEDVKVRFFEEELAGNGTIPVLRKCVEEELLARLGI